MSGITPASPGNSASRILAEVRRKKTPADLGGKTGLVTCMLGARFRLFARGAIGDALLECLVGLLNGEQRSGLGSYKP